MGTVWLAEDQLLQRRVAVKEVAVPPGMSAAEGVALNARVLREARAAARLSHPNVTTVYDVLQEEGRTWIVMEYVDAPTVSDLVERTGPMAPQRAASIGLGVLAALIAAHRAGIVHRDVKPGNVMIPQDGAVKLADFGVASVAGDPKLTVTGLIIGSPNYMSPEQASEGETQPATDIWGLGATLYYAVEGRSPFERGQAIPTLTAVLHDEPHPMRHAGPLAELIADMLAKDPAQRPAATHVRQWLEAIAAAPVVLDDTEAPATIAMAAAPPQTAVLATQDSGADPSADGPPEQQWGEDYDYEEPPRWSRWIAALAALALLAVGAVMLLRPDDPTAQVADARAEQRSENATAQDPQPAEADPAPTEPAPAAPEDTTGEQAAAPADEEVAEAPVDAPAEDAPEQAAQGADDATVVPAGWKVVDVSPSGATVAVPEGWQPRERSATATDWIDPETGAYLRLDWTDDPGDDAVAAWEQQSDSFAARHDNYEEISIEPYDYGGYESALWEYRYTSGRAQLRAYNLAIAGKNYGQALNLQTREADWDDYQDEWDMIVDSFKPGNT